MAKVDVEKLSKIAEGYRTTTPLADRIMAVDAVHCRHPDRPILTALTELLFIGKDAPLRYFYGAKTRAKEMGYELA